MKIYFNRYKKGRYGNRPWDDTQTADLMVSSRFLKVK